MTLSFPLPDVTTWVSMATLQGQQILKAQKGRVPIKGGQNLDVIHM